VPFTQDLEPGPHDAVAGPRVMEVMKTYAAFCSCSPRRGSSLQTSYFERGGSPLITLAALDGLTPARQANETRPVLTYVLIAFAPIAVTAKLVEKRTPRVYEAVLLVAIVAPLVATVYAMWRLWEEWIGWRELTLFVVLYLLTGIGTTVGYHRLVAHESFRTRPSVKAVLLALGAMNVQGQVINWAAYHRRHHAHSDREGDPHSPREGLLHAHVGWLFRASPYIVAGSTGLLWGGLVRIAFTNHVTFAVNSICHMYGSRPFATKDASRNNLLIGLLGFGEGWHNNHHAFPRAAFHGIGWRQPDVSGLIIRGLERVGLAWDVRRAPATAVDAR
jgi:stearoyl-CoA desaturase (delta-9 desaturase)